MQKATEDQWEIEDTKFFAEVKQSWDKYNKTAEDLVSARQEASQAENLARVSQVPLERNARPDFGDIGSDTVEKMQEQITALRVYAIELNKRIPDAIKMKEQEFQSEKAVEEEEERQRKAKEALEIEQFGTSGELLDIAKSLAKEAEEKLGSAEAKTLFESTCNASYGRARRQGDIEEALGREIPKEASSFYNLSRASDVNAILRAVTRILG